MSDADRAFYERADAHIHLANDQLSEQVSIGDVSASAMFGVARFNAYTSAADFGSSQELAAEKMNIIEYFVGEYRQMLAEHLADYIQHFDEYLSSSADSSGE
ncbi:MAG: DUF3144 domain-containing protein [Thiothrix sp.]|nr:DUF3144 domain-containing protein [Thiothrix sp.]